MFQCCGCLFIKDKIALRYYLTNLFTLEVTDIGMGLYCIVVWKFAGFGSKVSSLVESGFTL